jgi:hypothetical protein
MRHTQNQVTERTQREFEALDSLVRSLAPADWARPVPRPETRAPWTAKDALAHIVYWKLHTTRVFRGEKRPRELRGLDVNAINDIVYREWRDKSPADVLAWHREVHERVMQAIAAKPPEWFGRREHSQHWPGDFDGHSSAHRHKDIEAALSP